jgi:hypothetical protein
VPAELEDNGYPPDMSDVTGPGGYQATVSGTVAVVGGTGRTSRTLAVLTSPA